MKGDRKEAATCSTVSQHGGNLRGLERTTKMAKILAKQFVEKLAEKVNKPYDVINAFVRNLTATKELNRVKLKNRWHYDESDLDSARRKWLFSDFYIFMFRAPFNALHDNPWEKIRILLREISTFDFAPLFSEYKRYTFSERAMEAIRKGEPGIVVLPIEEYVERNHQAANFLLDIIDLLERHFLEGRCCDYAQCRPPIQYQEICNAFGTLTAQYGGCYTSTHDLNKLSFTQNAIAVFVNHLLTSEDYDFKLFLQHFEFCAEDFFLPVNMPADDNNYSTPAQIQPPVNADISVPVPVQASIGTSCDVGTVKPEDDCSARESTSQTNLSDHDKFYFHMADVNTLTRLAKNIKLGYDEDEDELRQAVLTLCHSDDCEELIQEIKANDVKPAEVIYKFLARFDGRIYLAGMNAWQKIETWVDSSIMSLADDCDDVDPPKKILKPVKEKIPADFNPPVDKKPAPMPEATSIHTADNYDAGDNIETAAQDDTPPVADSSTITEQPVKKDRGDFIMNTNEVQEKSLVPADEPLFHAMCLYKDSLGKYPKAARHEIEKKIIAADIADARQHLDELPKSQRRGLTLETLRHFNCGYLAQWTVSESRGRWLCNDPKPRANKHFLNKLAALDKMEEQCASGAAELQIEKLRKKELKRRADEDAGLPFVPPPSERIIIPTFSNTHFNAVCTPKARSSVETLYWKQHSGHKEIFFPPDALVDDVLFPNVKDVVVVEGEFDAMSIWQATGGSVAVVAMQGCRGWDEIVGKHGGTWLKGKRYVILLDGDAAGRNGADVIVKQLQSEFIAATKYFLVDYLSDEERRHPENNKIDANELLKRGQAQRLKSIMEKIIHEAHATLDEIEQRLEAEKAAQGDDANPELNVRHCRHWNSGTASTAMKSDKPLSPDIAALRDTIKESITPDDLESHGYLWHSANGSARPNGYCCPKCNSGDKAHKTGALSWTLSPIPLFCCQSCEFGGDVITFLANAYDAGTRGKDFYTLLRRIADDFGIPYNPKIFEVKKTNQPTNQVTLPDNTPEYVKAGITAFETENGEINPDVIPKICAAAQKIDALNVGTLTATDVVDFAFIGSLATLKYYLPTRYTEFIEQYKKLDKPPISASTLESKVKDCERKRKKEHREYCKAYRQQQQADEAAARLSARNQATADNLKKITELYQQPQSPERDAQIVELVKASAEWKVDRRGVPVAVAATDANADLIFAYDPDLRGLVGFDKFERCEVFLKAPPWNHEVESGTPLTDRDDAHIHKFIRSRYTEFVDKEGISQTITAFADKNGFHPIRQYFENLPKWDGCCRSRKYFVNLLFADDTAYTHEVTMKWLLGLVARVYHPGCNFPWALVLQGAQGIGKSRSIHLLGGKWHKVLSYSVDDPHAVDALKNTWIVELEEFAAVRKSELNAMKSFISRSADNQRAAYARRAEDVPRQCGFVGTVNDTEIYTDRTGNRRFVTVRCHRVKGDCFEAPPKGFIAQVWAEVFARYNEMFADGFDVSKLELSDETKRISENVAQEHMRDDGLDGQIAAFLNMKIPPQVIWDLFGRDEKRQFCAGGGVLETSQSAEDFIARRKALGGKKSLVLADVEEIRRILENNRRYARPIQRYNSQWLAIYGTEYRKRVCAVEIGNEAFEDDSRRLTLKINEILPTLKGWHEGARDQNYPCYGNQRHVYYRDDDNTPADDDNAPAQPLTAPVGCDSPDDKFDLSQFDRD